MQASIFLRQLLSALAVAACASHVAAQGLPTERKGVNGRELATVKLPADFDMSKGRALRMREVTILPGGFLPMHSHADRPSVFHVLRGTLTEHVEGEAEPRSYLPGHSGANHGAKGHALQNRGDEPVVFLEIDLP